MTGAIEPSIETLASRRAISLSELESDALRTRVDRKYVVARESFVAIAAALPDSFGVLEIAGRRSFSYETVYYDSPTLEAYRAHLQGRRRRYKARSRHYVDSGLHRFEVKLKGSRGETVKHQMPYRPEDHGRVNDKARVFLAAHLAEAYPGVEIPELEATVATSYRRTTLSHGAEKVTCDFDLSFSDGGAEVPGLDPRYLIIESKVERGLGAVDHHLRRLGVQPVTCSKYCVGVGLLREDVKVNELRWLINRYFGSDHGHVGIPTRVLAHG